MTILLEEGAQMTEKVWNKSTENRRLGRRCPSTVAATENVQAAMRKPASESGGIKLNWKRQKENLAKTELARSQAVLRSLAQNTKRADVGSYRAEGTAVSRRTSVFKCN